jgi:2-polyprenyl-3-methyl-5-hydroxy-6-metoxy-1,4-benzoquinol methylase
MSDYERGGTQKTRYAPEDVESIPCPYCGSSDATELAREYGAIGIVRCACGLIYTSPRPRDPERNYWGDRDTYYREAKLVFEGRRSHHRDPNYREELAFIAKYVPTGRFLDVGCNMGMLLRHAHRMEWDAWGVEPSPSLSSLARDELGLSVHTCYLSEVPADFNGTCDVVALSDVFEHVTDPLGMLAHARRMLKAGGILFVKVPNGLFSVFKHRLSRLLGTTLQHGVWDSYEHVVHYTDVTLRRMLEKGGFRVVELRLAKPVQVPVWHHLVGHYFQYPTPWTLDWKRHIGRIVLHRLGQLERAARGGSVGYLPPSLAVIAKPIEEVARS